MKKANRIYTDNSLIDEIVRQCKEMILNGIVLKDEQRANDNETVDSIKKSDLYADAIEGKDMFEMYSYPYSTLIKIPYMTSSLAKIYAINNSTIPNSIRPNVMKIEREKFLDGYEEQNNYYRMLYGLPNLNEKGIYLTADQKKRIPIRTFDAAKYIHEMNDNEINILETYGIVDELIEMYPDKEYLNHLGEKRIDPYLARKAAPFSLLYLPSCDANEVHYKFKDYITQNRQYILSTLYSEAFKYQSEYYDKFIMGMIITQAFIDMIVFSPEYIIRRDLFDLRTIQYVFESQGVKFFPDIPLKYQKRLVKNLNRLLKFKSSDKNLIDIASLFGFDDVRLFRYYILKDPIMNEDGTYKRDTITNPKTEEEEEDVVNNYELKFVKVDFNGISDEAIRDPLNIMDYDQFVEDDVYWNGTYTKEYVKHKILEHNFNMEVSKYIGMEIVYSMTELAFQVCYFINMLVYSGIDTSSLLVEIPSLSSSTKFPLIDCFISLFSLGYLYKGLEDNIMYYPVQVMDVLGFNFDVDMDKLASYIYEKGYTPEDLGVENFIIPSNGIFSYNQLIEIFTNNKNIRNHLIHEMVNANDKDIYDIYKKIYDSLFITKLNFEYFSKNGIKPKTYSEFLSSENSILYDAITRCRIIEDDKERRLQVSQLINSIVESIYVYLDESDFNLIFHGIPTAGIDYLLQYMFQVLNFFKSYKVDFTHVNMVFKLDDRNENWIKVIDRMYLKHIFTKSEVIPYEDYINTWVHLEPKETIELIENLNIEITYWIARIFKDRVPVDDRIAGILVHLLKQDFIFPDKELLQIIHKLYKSEAIPYEDYINTWVHKQPKENIGIEDTVFIEYKYKLYEEPIY